MVYIKSTFHLALHSEANTRNLRQVFGKYFCDDCFSSTFVVKSFLKVENIKNHNSSASCCWSLPSRRPHLTTLANSPTKEPHLPDIIITITIQVPDIITITIWYEATGALYVSICDKLFAFSLSQATIAFLPIFPPNFPFFGGGISHPSLLGLFWWPAIYFDPNFPSFLPLAIFAIQLPPTHDRGLSQIAPSSVAIVSLA